ncbi:MAG: diacylglycerol/lipid kinase family protein [Gemmatimonadaceae bacterium]
MPAPAPPPAPPRRPTIALVIHGARASDPTLRAAVDEARARGIRVRPRVTYDPGDAATFAGEEAAAGVDVVIAAGGDGTVNEVLNGLAGYDTPMGIIPLGTANDFARQMGIPLDASHAMDLILSQPPVRLDTASLNGRRFVNVSSGGIAAEATAETSTAAKAALGPLAYALTGLRKLVNLDPLSLRLEAPGLEREIEAVVFFVGNQSEAGGGMPVTPHASPHDGLLDVCLVETQGRAELARLALLFGKGEQVGEPGVLYLRVPWIRMRSQAPVQVNVDGEPMEATDLLYQSRPGDLLIHLPRTPAAAFPDASSGTSLPEAAAADSVTAGDTIVDGDLPTDAVPGEPAQPSDQAGESRPAPHAVDRRVRPE